MATNCPLLAPTLPWLDHPPCTGPGGERRGTVATGNARQRDAAARPGHPGFRERIRMVGPDRAVRHARPARLRPAPQRARVGVPCAHRWGSIAGFSHAHAAILARLRSGQHDEQPDPAGTGKNLTVSTRQFTEPAPRTAPTAGRLSAATDDLEHDKELGRRPRSPQNPHSAYASPATRTDPTFTHFRWSEAR